MKKKVRIFCILFLKKDLQRKCPKTLSVRQRNNEEKCSLVLKYFWKLYKTNASPFHAQSSIQHPPPSIPNHYPQPSIIQHPYIIQCNVTSDLSLCVIAIHRSWTFGCILRMPILKNRKITGKKSDLFFVKYFFEMFVENF